jgi:hypothetical protein
VKTDEVSFSNIHAVIIGKLNNRRTRGFEVQTNGKATSICGNFKNQVPQYFVEMLFQSENNGTLKILAKGKSG